MVTSTQKFNNRVDMEDELCEAGYPELVSALSEAALIRAYNIWCNPSNDWHNITQSRELGINRSRNQSANGKFRKQYRK